MDYSLFPLMIGSQLLREMERDRKNPGEDLMGLRLGYWQEDLRFSPVPASPLPERVRALLLSQERPPAPHGLPSEGFP